MNTYIERYNQLGLAGGSMSATEIEALSASLSQTLPPSFCAYLSLAGSSPPPKLVGSDCHGSHLPELYESAIELLDENGRPFALPRNSVVFLMHQGYQFFYFIADGSNPDPAVYYYLEGEPVAERKYATFSDWVQAIAT